MTAEIPISEVKLRPTETRKDFMDELKARAKSASTSEATTPMSSSWKSVADEKENTFTKQMSLIRTAVMESAKAERLLNSLKRS
ncbi:hypothetical protein RB195_015488 [Necator americanus]